MTDSYVFDATGGLLIGGAAQYSGSKTDDLIGIREALEARLRQDPDLLALLGGAERIYHRMRKAAVEAREVTYFDIGSVPTPGSPLRTFIFEIDVWDTDPERAEAAAARIEALLDDKPWGFLPGTWANVAMMQITRDSGVMADDGDLVRSILQFTVHSFDLEGVR